MTIHRSEQIITHTMSRKAFQWWYICIADKPIGIIFADEYETAGMIAVRVLELEGYAPQRVHVYPIGLRWNRLEVGSA
jgi:hypothetical protein